jgi:hypothetical protein
MAVSMATGLLFSTSLRQSQPKFAFPTPSSTFHNNRVRPLRTVISATVSQPPAGGKGRGIMQPKKISPEMQDLVGLPEISRTQALKHIWAHIKENNLQVSFRPLLSLISITFSFSFSFSFIYLFIYLLLFKK